MNDPAEFEQSKNEFLRHVSHNLRSPVAAALTSLRTLDTGLIADPADAQKLLRNAILGAEHMLAILDDITALLHIETLNLPPPQDHPLRPATLAAAAPATALAARRGINFTIEAPEESFRIDPKSFKLLIANLVQNAVDYSDPASAPSLRLEIEQDSLKIHVSSKGLLLDPGDCDKMYKQFWRGPDAHKYAPRGTGLGLSIVRKIVDLHRGSIHAAPTPDRGVEFHLTLHPR